ncbi:class I SAM-dependent methyltransferase [Stratiformator vulcanicus]|uniref:Class I SAM-dependent methyltransferase n=1 Tax=Stratiformator vulcanicus TaxID=2527980 RepID=A0A517QZR2_9PLAN|nr:class I SAM-dependent methyltransferase [Stratiformator vulcanicus]QDT37129.1 hypothetical protein Pan189_14970 [Stratiformator vulcanicus]
MTSPSSTSPVSTSSATENSSIASRLLALLPGGREISRRRRKRKLLAEAKSAAEVFTDHYATNDWGDAESASGPGSTLEYTANIRRELPKLVQELGVKTILDAPCGDYNWFRAINWESEIEYLGGDIVAPLIERNYIRHAGENVNFRTLNIIEDPLPTADLWLCRDCLFHLSNADICRTLTNFLESGVTFLLTTTHHEATSNRDIVTGSFRLLNLERAPFFFPQPIHMMDDWIEGFPPRQLALWSREQLAEALRDTEWIRSAHAA